MSVAAYFDLDGTVLRGHAERQFLLALARRRRIGVRALWRSLAVAARADAGPLALRWKANKTYLAGLPLPAVTEWAAECVRERVWPRIAPAAVAAIARHRQSGHRLVLLTGSLELLAIPVAQQLQMDDVLATVVAVEAGRLSGRIVPPHPYGSGKRQALERHAAACGIDLARSYAYADSAADIPCLSAVGHPHLVNPSLRLALWAGARDWPVLIWK